MDCLPTCVWTIRLDRMTCSFLCTNPLRHLNYQYCDLRCAVVRRIYMFAVICRIEVILKSTVLVQWISDIYLFCLTGFWAWKSKRRADMGIGVDLWYFTHWNYYSWFGSCCTDYNNVSCVDLQKIWLLVSCKRGYFYIGFEYFIHLYEWLYNRKCTF